MIWPVGLNQAHTHAASCTACGKWVLPSAADSTVGWSRVHTAYGTQAEPALHVGSVSNLYGAMPELELKTNPVRCSLQPMPHAGPCVVCRTCGLSSTLHCMQHTLSLRLTEHRAQVASRGPVLHMSNELLSASCTKGGPGHGMHTLSHQSSPAHWLWCTWTAWSPIPTGIKIYIYMLV